jgi:hypothetical protein
VIDTFQWFVWPVNSDLHEGFPSAPAGADSPQARRLQCLFAEARAAGVPTRVLFSILLDWARLLERAATSDRWHAKLNEAITVTDAALDREGQPLPTALRRSLVALEALEAREGEETAVLRVARLLASHFDQLILRGGEADPETAWDGALLLLGAIGDVVEARELEAAMTECAHLAYKRLFPQRDS